MRKHKITYGKNRMRNLHSHMTIGMTIDQTTEGTKAAKDMAIGTKIVVDLGTETEEIEAVPGESFPIQEQPPKQI